MKSLLILSVLLLGLVCVRAQDIEVPAEIQCDDVTCDLYCDNGFKLDENSCPICQCKEPDCQGIQCDEGKECRVMTLPPGGHKIPRCIDPRLPDRCVLPVSPGTCRQEIQRYFYNTEADACEPFLSGDCPGNDNRFDDLASCNATCGAPCPDMMCDRFCEYGYQADERGCASCLCKPAPPKPCPEVTCDLFCDYGKRKDSNNCDICQCEPCPNFICQMYCDNGFKVDSDGCQYCECNDPAPEARCEPFLCQMYCDFGMQVNEVGCPICACLDPPEKSSECAPVGCDRFCENGFAKDEAGCDKCECRLGISEVNAGRPECGEVMCMLYCQDGFQVDEQTGCAVCRCRGWAPIGRPVCDDVLCDIYCDYGLMKDGNGCPVCECQDDPCEVIDCPDGTKCMVEHQQNQPTCVAEDVRTWCPGATCDMYCEHGYRTDQLGCDTCRCLQEPKPQCGEVMCMMFCEFGYKFNQFGCSVCECLPDPCATKACDMTRVCEVQEPECARCPSQAVCVGVKQVQRIKVDITFSHESVDGFDSDEFEALVRERMSPLLDTDKEYIRGVTVDQLTPSRTRVTFHVVSYGMGDIVSSYRSFEMSIKSHQDGTSFSYNGVVYVPEHRTLYAAYYRNPEISGHEGSHDDDDDEDDDGVSMGVIIGCSIAGAFALIILVLAIVFIVKGKKKGHNKPNVQYQKAPDGTPPAVEKEPLPTV